MTLSATTFPDTSEEEDFRRAERDLLPSRELETVLRSYGIPESQQTDIVSFLVENPEVVRVLLAALPNLESIFGNAYRYLEMERDPDGGEEEIFGVIFLRGVPAQALELLRQFDELWFSEATKDTGSRLNFTVEIEDGDPV